MSDTKIGTAYFDITPTAKGITGKMTKVLNGDAVGESVGSSIGGKIKAMVIGAGIGTALMKSIKVGANLEQQLGGVETLFGKSADVVIKNAERAWKTAGLSADQYMEQSTSFSASLLQSLKGDTEKTAKYSNMAIIDMSDNANKMGTSIENIQNAYQGFAKQNYTMLDNLKLGYGGTKSEMERLLKDASALSGKKYNINNLADVFDAIHTIQGELKITGTTSKEAAITLEGSFNAMKSAVTNILGNMALGRDVTQPMADLIDSSVTFVVGNLAPAIGRVIMAIPPAIGSALPTIADKLGTASEKLAKMMGDGTSEKMSATAVTILEKLGNALLKNAPRILYSLVRITAMIGVMLLRNAPKLIGVFLRVGLKCAGGLLMGIRNVLGSVYTIITSPITRALARVKNLFSNIKLRLGGIKLPHLQVNWEKLSGWKQKALEKLGLQGLPTLGVNWYKTGGIFNDPSIIGVGEAGTEAVVPLDQLWSRFDSMIDAVGNTQGTGDLNLIIDLDGSTIAKSTIKYVNGQSIRYGVNPLLT